MKPLLFEGAGLAPVCLTGHADRRNAGMIAQLRIGRDRPVAGRAVARDFVTTCLAGLRGPTI
jgi:hypothetical protein